MDEVIFNRFDQISLREYGADLENKQLRKRYQELRDTWIRGNKKGEMPMATILDLASRYQLKAVPELAEAS